MSGRGRAAGVGIGTGVALVAALLGTSSCKSLSRVVDLGDSAPAPQVLEGNEIPLVITRFPAPPREVYSAAGRFFLRISFDPVVVDLSRLVACGLWCQDHEGGPWRRIGTYPAKREPAATRLVPPADGAYGLRASAIYADGTELFTPSAGDRPVVWLVVDRTPPRLSWVSPSPGAPLGAGDRLDLQWGASEVRFGEAPAVLEWSADGGASWSPIDRVKAGPGTGKASWRVPDAAVAPGAKPLVRITAWDLVGNRASAVLPLAGAGSVPAERREAVATAAPLPDQPAAAPRSASLRERGGARVAPEPAVDRTRRGPRPPRTGAERDGSAAGTASTPPGAAASVPAASGARRRVPEARISLRNLDDGAVQRGGADRYLFFETEGMDLGRTRVTVEWRSRPGEPWTALARDVPAGEGKARIKVPAETTAEGAVRLTAIETGPSGGEAARAEATGEAPVPVDSEPPAVTIRSADRVEAGAALVSIAAEDRGPAGLGEVTLHVTEDGGATWRELPVEDAGKPVRVEASGPTLGLWAAAADRVGNATPKPAAGAVPQRTVGPEGKATLAVDDLEGEYLRGGEQRYITWKFQGPADLRALLESSRDGGASWEPVGELPAASGRALWVAPAESGAAIVRVRVRLPDGSLVEGRTRPVKVDAAAPQLEAGEVPARVGAELKFPLTATDPGGSGLAGLAAWTRPAAAPGGKEGSAWTERPGSRIAFDAAAGRATISVADLPEGAYELFLSARDRAGNGGLTPGVSAAPAARFSIDRTPVAIRAAPTALPWVEGGKAAVQVELDLSNAVPPLWLEERSETAWTEVLRWETLGGGDLFQFPVPVGRDRYEVRFGIRDAVGNVSYAVVGPRAVERAIRLSPIPESLKEGANQSIAWIVHPAVLNDAGADLKVVVSHQPKESGEWVQLYDDLAPGGSCVFTAPAADGEAHRLKASLLRLGKVIGEDVSAPFRIAAGAPRPTRVDPRVVEVKPESLYRSERGELQFETYRSVRSQYQKWFAGAAAAAGLKRDGSGSLPASELEKLSPEVRRQAAERERALDEAAQKIRENFQKAVEIDPANYRAAYGMAQLLHRTTPDRPDEAIRWLEKCVQVKPDHAAALNDLGATRILKGDYEGAEDALRKALAVEDSGTYHYNLALALFHQKRTAEARTHFEEALSKGGTAVRTGEVYYYLVAAYLQEGQGDEARRRLALYRDQIPGPLAESLAAALGGR